MKKIFILSLFLTSKIAMGMQEENYTLRSVSSLPLSQVAQAKAMCTYKRLPHTLGNSINVIDGELQIACPDLSQENKAKEIFNTMEEQILGGYSAGKEFKLVTQSFKASGTQFIGKTGCTLSADEKFEATYVIFGSDEDVSFTAPVLSFDTCFVKVTPENSTIKIFPTSSLNSPIEYLQFTPKQSPVIINGSIDFNTLSFDHFFVSHSDLLIQFRNPN